MGGDLMVRGKILLAILNQREQKVLRDFGLKKEDDRNDNERENLQTKRA